MNYRQDNPFEIQEPRRRRYSVSGFSQRQHEGTHLAHKPGAYGLGLPIKTRFTRLVLIVFLVVLVGIGLRVFQLQVIAGPTYRELAEGNRVKLERSLAPRGIIFDRALTALVSNEPLFTLKIIPANIASDKLARQDIAERLLALVKDDSHVQDIAKLTQLIESIYISNKEQDTVVTLLDELDHDTAIRVQLEADLPGVLLEQGILRGYLQPESTAHVVGYLGKISSELWPSLSEQGYYFGDLVGRAGLEREYEDKLRGTDKVVEVEVNAQGEEQRIIAEQSLEPGQNLILTIDAALQQRLYETLERFASRAGGKAAAVALDPSSGEILALVSTPGFDANAFVRRESAAVSSFLQDERQPLFNRAISGEYPPGSTFKPVVASAALEQGLITPQTSFLSSGGLELNNFFYPDWQAGGHGWTNLNRAIAESVNTYFYYLSGGFEDFDGLGVEAISEHAREYNLGELQGIDLSGEATGFLPSKVWKESTKGEPWYVGDTYHLGIGQGDILLTPLQLASVTATFANGGTLYQPHLLRAVSNPSGEVVENIEPNIIKTDFVAKETIGSIRRALRETVLSGSAVSLQSLPKSSAGKTGTAQVGGDGLPHGWFTGWAPYDEPEIVMTVLVENGTGGGTTALPVFREVMNWYLSTVR